MGIHATLSAGGAIPGFGVVPDVIDWLYTAAELPFGKSTKTDFALATAGILATAAPVVGDGPAAAAKVALRVSRAAGNVGGDAARAAGRVDGVYDVGRAGKQARLRELVNDPNLGSADRGWIRQEMNSIERGQRSSIRNPPGKDLAHERGREAAKGYDYSHSHLQDRDLHRLQHKYDDFGRANAERPVP